MPSKQFIHIGANKTASTTLQRSLFSKLSDIHYLGEDGENYENVRETLNSITYDDDFHYKHLDVEKLFQNFLTSSNSKIQIYSNEDIMTSRVPALCAKRLKKLMPDAKVILVIRNQLTAIPSWYANHGAFLRNVPASYWRRYVSFDDWMSHCTDFLNYSPLDGFFYNEILTLYASLFGKENIHVLMFEQFVQNKQIFVADLSKILEIDKIKVNQLLTGRHERKRITQRQFKLHRLQEKYFCGQRITFPFKFVYGQEMWDRFLAGGLPVGDFLTEVWRQKIIELYQDSNMKLAQQYELPLDKFEYPLFKT